MRHIESLEEESQQKQVVQQQKQLGVQLPVEEQLKVDLANLSKTVHAYLSTMGESITKVECADAKNVSTNLTKLLEKYTKANVVFCACSSCCEVR